MARRRLDFRNPMSHPFVRNSSPPATPKGPGRGYFLSAEAGTKRAVAFFDGQNLFHAAKAAFGHGFPNYDPRLLAAEVCRAQGWTLVEARFYTGVPDARDDAFWNHFWVAKLRQMGRVGVHTFKRSLRYRNRLVQIPGGGVASTMVGQEKGIDVRIALDVVRLAQQNVYDVGVIFSQDQDLSEAADEVRLIAREQQRWIKLASAFPSSPTAKNDRGINKTDWIAIDRATYDSCLDRRDYRPKGTAPP
jgi:uncharacterized LabA/DUF88 family protein